MHLDAVDIHQVLPESLEVALRACDQNQTGDFSAGKLPRKTRADAPRRPRHQSGRRLVIKGIHVNQVYQNGTVRYTFSRRNRFLKFYLALATAVALLTAPAVRAQQPGQPNPEAVAFTKSLGITPAQKAKMDAIRAKYSPKIKAIGDKLRQEGGANPNPAKQQELMKKGQALVGPLYAAAQKEMTALLTPAQRAKVKAFEAKMRAKAGGKG